MRYELRKIVSAFVISLALIRFWIEIVTTTILKNSRVLNSINNNGVYHHYQLGIIIMLIAIVLIKTMPNWKLYANIALGFGLALFLDQYTYILSVLSIDLPFGYRSSTDYLIISISVIGLVLYWVLLKKRANDE